MYTYIPPPRIVFSFRSFHDCFAYSGNRAFIVFFLYAVFVLLLDPSYSQVRTSIDSGSKSRTSVSLSNTMGVYTNLETTPNVEGSVNANLVIAPGSTIQDSFGGAQPGASSITGAVVVTPNSANIDLTGLAAQNNYIVGAGTAFSSNLQTINGAECTGACASHQGSSVGKASTGMSHSMSLTIDQTNSSFSNSFSQNF